MVVFGRYEQLMSTPIFLEVAGQLEPLLRWVIKPKAWRSPRIQLLTISLSLALTSRRSNDYEVRMWNGSDWTTISVPGQADNGIINPYNSKRVAVAWESATGQALFAVSYSNSFRYWIYDRVANSWTCPANGQTITDLDNWQGSNGPCNGSAIHTWPNNVGPIRLAADPRSSDIFLMGANGETLDIQLQVLKWDGSTNSFSRPTHYDPEADVSPGVFNTPQGHVFAFAFDHLSPTAVRLASFSADAYEDGVLLKWRTGYEADNLGFHLYREEDGRLIRLNPQMIAGSALRAGQGITTAGYSYSWLDAVSDPLPALSQEESRERGGGPGWGGLSPQSSPLSPVRYWLEDIDLSGKRTWHGPIAPVFSDGPLPKRTQAVLLSHLNRKSRKGSGSASVRWVKP